jgi:excinuclease ABC subunit A
MKKHPIVLKKVAVHNLKEVDLTLNSHELIVFTGVSGSGKSSMAFDTIYAEGQRRYIESLSTFARRFLGDMSKPDVESVAGLSPTISIEQKSSGKNPRSTVGTMTEIYDYLRVLFARIGIPHCPISGEPVCAQGSETIIKTIQQIQEGTKLIILSPFAKKKKGEFKEEFQFLQKKGYMRVRLDGEIVDLSEEISLDKNQSHDVDVVIDRLVCKPEMHSRIAEAVTAALEMGEGSLYVLENEKERLFSTHAYSVKSDTYYEALQPGHFSFNSPSGMCPRCQGLGETLDFDLEKIIDPEKSIVEDCCIIAGSYETVRYGNIYRNLGELYDFDIDTPWKDLPKKAQNIFLRGVKKKWIQMHFVHPTKGISWTDYVSWKGVLHEATKKYQEAKSEGYKKRIEALMSRQKCPECEGARLKPFPAATKLRGKTLFELTDQPIEDLLRFFDELVLNDQERLIGAELLKEICERLRFLLFVGLNYLSLNRTSPTLSGGEAQRVRLAAQVGCGLVGVTYVLDEPSIGLHPRDNQKLIDTLKHLRDVGNTVIVVEHDEETILAADRIVDFGPGPGRLGGEITLNGTLEDLLKSKTLTGQYLSGKKEIYLPKKRTPFEHSITIRGAAHHNLKGIDVSFPLGIMVAVTGVSGSGKSSLVSETLVPLLTNHLHHGKQVVGKHTLVEGLEHVDKVIAIDQSPIGRNPRSNPATYIKIFDEIRTLFAQLPESVAKGFLPGRFSFNVSDGSCTQCKGLGMISIDMDFLEKQWVTCPTCNNQRFDQQTLCVRYKGKNIYEVLEMSIDEALEFFQNIPALQRKLSVVSQVGLGYLNLGQPSPTLSGGEAQRMKLAKELVRPSTGHTFYVLDEPTTGLHFHDIHTLLNVLHTLVKRGNTLLVIEHNMDVVKTADWVIDLGPEAGSGGGTIVGEGTPEEISKLKTPTAIALKPLLQPKKILAISEKREPTQPVQKIRVEGACQNNLKHINVEVPRGSMIACCGPSGSGKSSFAFETVYAESQRRYTESLSPYARQFVEQMPKPKLSQIEGLSPGIAIEQKAHAGNPRSTVGTQTEIYDYLRLLFTHVGMPYCPETGERIVQMTPEDVVEKILTLPEGVRLTLLAPLEISKEEQLLQKKEEFQKLGYLRIEVNGTLFELDEEIPFESKRKNKCALVIDRLKVVPSNRSRLFEGVEKALMFTNKEVVAKTEEKEYRFYLDFSVPSTGKSYPPLTPHSFSFNSREGMCLECLGLGYLYGANLMENEALQDLSVRGLLTLFLEEWNHPMVLHFLERANINPKKKLLELTDEQRTLFLNGEKEESFHKYDRGLSVRWVGLQTLLAFAGKHARSQLKEPLLELLHQVTCFSCQGARLNPQARSVRIKKHTIASCCALPIEKLITFIDEIPLTKKQEKILAEVMPQLKRRLSFLSEVGLDYISLDRPAPTLSNGETQRIKLARQLGSQLRGILYVLDEPTTGLHPHDTQKLGSALDKLKELGNTLLLVEHDPLILEQAEYLLDFGPGAGHLGGHITAQGTYKQLLKNNDSLTGQYLSGKKTLPYPKKKREAKEFLKIEKVSAHNLKGFDLEIPLGLFTCVTGVSGSGKSTLMEQELIPYVKKRLKEREPFDKLLIVDQNPVGQTARADIGTYTDLLSSLRTFYAELGKARTKGLKPRHFSYNHKRGMCTTCYGMGYKKVEMLFMPAVRVPCDQCNGLRLNPISLEVEYEGKNFGQLLKLTIDQLAEQFPLLPKVQRICTTLQELGLGYLQVGQEIASLSGGEAGRVKLSKELSKRGKSKTLYVLDEPTTGLHPDDMAKLLILIQKLVDKGHTVVVIEHQMDFVKAADYLIDLGPEAGEKGGELVYAGPPEKLKSMKSLTSRYLI